MNVRQFRSRGARGFDEQGTSRYSEVVKRLSLSLFSLMKFKIKKNSKEEFFWVLVAGNGEPICLSEGYKTREGAVRSINLVKLDASRAEIVDTTVIFRRFGQEN